MIYTDLKHDAVSLYSPARNEQIWSRPNGSLKGSMGGVLAISAWWQLQLPA
jgi:hypothetical protein